MTHSTDIDLTTKQIAQLASSDALAAWLGHLGYDTACRATLTPESIGLSGESAGVFKKIELLSEDAEHFLRVVFAQPKSLTAKARNDLSRVLGRSNIDHLLIIAADFDTLEFVLLDKRKREKKGPSGIDGVQVFPKVVSVDRRGPTRLDLRTLRRFTWTSRDGLEQFDKLRSVFDAAAYTGEYFQNRGLFSDYYLRERLREDRVWRDNPSETFAFVRDLLKEAAKNIAGKGKDAARKELLEPVFKRLGFKSAVNRPSKSDQTQPDYLLKDAQGRVVSAAFVYAWDRWLDGPDFHDADTPDENPGACVVTALDSGQAEWIIVTNGRHWRIYSKHAHARATNFYEVDLAEALTASGDTDPNEAFRYWWLLFRLDAFVPGPQGTWLDAVLRGSREYAKRLGDRLKDRVFISIFPHLAQGFLEDRRRRLGRTEPPGEEELAGAYESTLAFLYRLLFLLYAESRDLLPVREAPYFAASLKKIKEEIAAKAGVAESEVAQRVNKAYSDEEAALYDRLARLFAAMDKGDPVLNVPTYNGGLFNTRPEMSDRRDQQIARFLLEHKIPDRYLALAVDRLSRDQDERTLGLVFIDYKSLEVRHLGSIYEGLLEFKLKVAEDDLTTQADKSGEKYVKLAEAKTRRGKQAEVVVRKDEVYLSNDKSQRKATGSYYTPDNIVQYIVEQTVGPVLRQKLEPLRAEFRKVRKTFDNEMQKARAYPPAEVRSGAMDERAWAAGITCNSYRELVGRFFDFRVLDPAMGSGHFLVEAVDFITDRLLDFLNQFPVNPVNFTLERTRASILQSLGEQGVTVDPGKLTDINLLKRHVLKRSVYGVDLNPMAVELAKVSLWLDAFTLGAPLSFLDHHLRCGNSLLGATFDDLRGETEGRLFSVNYAPLMLAILALLKVNQRADATAAEVGESATDYSTCRKDLDGYRVALDAAAAASFGITGAGQFATLAEVEPDAVESELQRSWREGREQLAEIERLAAEHRFFHWEIEFPEAFFDFTSERKAVVRHKDDIRPGSAGFDCVVGNPPYVRMELIKPIKPFLKRHYRCHAERADLFIYFHEKAIVLLRSNGYYSYICSSNWIKTAAGQNLRSLIALKNTILSFVDLTRANVFEDASTYPFVFVIKKTAPLSDDSLRASVVVANADVVAAAESFSVAQTTLGAQPWILSDKASSLLNTLLHEGKSVGEIFGSPLYGIKTGLNDAFVVSAHTKDVIVQSDVKAGSLLKPFLEGKDVRQWSVTPRDLWLIYATKRTPIRDYPAIYQHLSQYKTELEGRAANQKWYELQQAQAKYAEAFTSPKIIFPRFVNQPCFALDTTGFFINNAISAIPTGDRNLLFYLMSPVSWFILRALGAPMANGYRQIHGHVIERLPIPSFSDAAKTEIASWFDDAIESNRYSNPPWNLVFEAFGLGPQEQTIIMENQI